MESAEIDPLQRRLASTAQFYLGEHVPVVDSEDHIILPAFENAVAEHMQNTTPDSPIAK